MPPEFSPISKDFSGDSLPPTAPGKSSPLPTAIPPRLLRLATWLWLALLIAGSLQPARPGTVTRHHHVLHWLAFSGGALLLFLWAPTRRELFLRAFAVFFLGVTLEVLQHLIYRNGLEWRDIADDGVAILLAFAVHRLAAARKPGSAR